MNVEKERMHDAEKPHRVAATIEIIDFGETQYVEKLLLEADFLKGQELPKEREGCVRWINMDGPMDIAVVEKVTGLFGIHPLLAEDIADGAQRAKVEDYGDYLFVTAKMVRYEGAHFVSEHVSFILGESFVLSFGEVEGDVFQGIRSRVQNEASQLRKSRADYLLYALLDALVDGYFTVLEDIGDRIEELEEDVLSVDPREGLESVREVKKQLLQLHKYIWPIREVTGWLGRESTPLITKDTEYYIRDVYDHVIQIIDATDTHRELLSSLVDLYLSQTSHRLNEIMKVLTMISTIFIPLTFIVGVYGMNFRHMPELDTTWGYPLTWLVMVVIAILMVLFFKKKRWF